ncbi:MAG TPA: hypothetical protein VIY48_10220, partial [Candidatus Paceibacterota bacterium]
SKKEFAMDKKNPLFAGLLNMLVPGSGYWYVNQDRERFIKTLIVGVLAIAAILVLGSVIPNTKRFPVPQGVCVGILLLIVLVPLFVNFPEYMNAVYFFARNLSFRQVPTVSEG